MPSYDYRCPANHAVVEVQHRISEQVHNWGELCERAGIPLGDTPADAPVEKLATGGQVVRAGSLKNPEPPCGSGGCGAGRCQWAS
ncbi:MAG: zinc ribbon domain-containing protein [Gammaproteobacteria bacterium]|nr:MAG: zinc ribbon domain-containing protein [Gammaproteobacteria bacterium]